MRMRLEEQQVMYSVSETRAIPRIFPCILGTSRLPAVPHTLPHPVFPNCEIDYEMRCEFVGSLIKVYIFCSLGSRTYFFNQSFVIAYVLDFILQVFDSR